jgi:3-hydroxyisobutyryl-CoA hydrolase
MNRVATKLFSQLKNVRQFSTKMEDSSLLVSQNNKLLIMELNRPKALNALNLPMIHDMRKVLNERVNSSDTDVLLMKGAGGKSFCAGGDVKTLFSSVMAETGKFEATPGKAHVDFFRYEYNLDFALAVSPKPQISIWNGIVMGGGVGISVLGEFRVATEKTVFAMPECVIGLFPDVGGSAWLPHLSDGYGNYIGEFCNLSFLCPFA